MMFLPRMLIAAVLLILKYFGRRAFWVIPVVSLYEDIYACGYWDLLGLVAVSLQLFISVGGDVYRRILGE